MRIVRNHLIAGQRQHPVCEFVRRSLGLLWPDHPQSFALMTAQYAISTREGVLNVVTTVGVAPLHSPPLRAPATRPRVAIVDPNTAIRIGLPLMLRAVDFYAGYASCAEALLNRPVVDVVMLDPTAHVNGRSSTTAVDDIAAFVSAGFRVCLYTLDPRPHFLARCLRAGARGVVLKSDPLDTLVVCLRRVASGFVEISENVVLPAAGTGDAPASLTARQRQVLAGRARGEPFRRIARQLGISERTAHDHWSAIARNFAGFLTAHSPADLERSLGLDHGPATLTPEAKPDVAVNLGRELSREFTTSGRRRAAPRGPLATSAEHRIVSAVASPA